MDGLLYHCLYEYARDMVFYCPSGIEWCYRDDMFVVPISIIIVIFMIISLFLLLTYIVVYGSIIILIDEKENVNA